MPTPGMSGQKRAPVRLLNASQDVGQLVVPDMKVANGYGQVSSWIAERKVPQSARPMKPLPQPPLAGLGVNKHPVALM